MAKPLPAVYLSPSPFAMISVLRGPPPRLPCSACPGVVPIAKRIGTKAEGSTTGPLTSPPPHSRLPRSAPSLRGPATRFIRVIRGPFLPLTLDPASRCASQGKLWTLAVNLFPSPFAPIRVIRGQALDPPSPRLRRASLGLWTPTPLSTLSTPPGHPASRILPPAGPVPPGCPAGRGRSTRGPAAVSASCSGCPAPGAGRSRAGPRETTP